MIIFLSSSDKGENIISIGQIKAMQVAGTQSFIELLTISLNHFAATMGQAAPRIVAAVILLGIGYIAGRAIGWTIGKI